MWRCWLMWRFLYQTLGISKVIYHRILEHVEGLEVVKLGSLRKRSISYYGPSQLILTVPSKEDANKIKQTYSIELYIDMTEDKGFLQGPPIVEPPSHKLPTSRDCYGSSMGMGVPLLGAPGISMNFPWEDHSWIMDMIWYDMIWNIWIWIWLYDGNYMSAKKILYINISDFEYTNWLHRMRHNETQ